MSSIQESMLLNILNRQGVFYKVCISAWSATVKLKPSELGLPEDVNSSLLRLGSKRLIQKDALQPIYKIRNEAYRLIDTHSEPFFDNRFVPANTIQRVDEGLAALREEFWAAVDQFLVEYQSRMREMLDLWREEFRKYFGSDQETIENNMRSVRSAYPDVTRVREKFNFDWITFAMRLPDTEIAASVSNMQDIAATSEAMERARHRMTAQIELMVIEHAQNLEAQVVDLCNEVLETSANSPSGLNQRTVNKLTEHIAKIRQLNYADIKSVNDAIATLQEIVETPASVLRKQERGVQNFRSAVEAVKTEVEEALTQDKKEAIRGFIETGRRVIDCPF